MKDYEYQMIAAINQWALRNLFPKGLAGTGKAETYPAMLKRHGKVVFALNENIEAAIVCNKDQIVFSMTIDSAQWEKHTRQAFDKEYHD